MTKWLRDGLSSRNGFVRKGTAVALRLPRWWRRIRASHHEYFQSPPVFANSFPKSGTHLLFQIVDGLPNAANYGAFLASMTSSFQFRERSPENAGRFIQTFAPGEIVRGHLFFHPQNAAHLAVKNVVHYFVYRDLRDVVVSEAHYLRDMNRWHRLAPYFRNLASIDEAISLSINGLASPVPGIDYPNVAARFARYRGWVEQADCLAIRFEDLASENRPAVIRQMAEFYGRRCAAEFDLAACVDAMTASIAPEKSHTFRSGKKAGWQRQFTAEHRTEFAQVAGELLVELGYERDFSWVEAPLPQSV